MKRLLSLILPVFFTHMVISQSINPEVITSSGNYFKGANYSLSWTLGECVIETFSNSNYTLTQGFQQTWFKVGTLVKYPELNLNIKVYPNPASDFIWLDCGNATSSINALKVELVDIHGRILYGKNLTEERQQMSLRGLSQSVYFIRVTNRKNRLVKSFIIQKVD